MDPEDGSTPPSGPASVWERAQSRIETRPALTHARIAEAALRIADTEGLTALAMRRLAAELGVSAMTCYRYVTGKDEVLELMLDKVRADMVLDDPSGDWRETLRASALRFRDVVLHHPWITDVPGRILFTPTPALMVVTEQALSALDGLGLDIDHMADIAGAITAYARAGTHDEIARARLRSEGRPTGQDAREANLARLTWLFDRGEYPLYERYVHEGSPRDDPRARFEFGLDCLLDGIAARVGNLRQSPGR